MGRVPRGGGVLGVTDRMQLLTYGADDWDTWLRAQESHRHKPLRDRQARDATRTAACDKATSVDATHCTGAIPASTAGEGGEADLIVRPACALQPEDSDVPQERIEDIE